VTGAATTAATRETFRQGADAYQASKAPVVAKPEITPHAVAAAGGSSTSSGTGTSSDSATADRTKAEIMAQAAYAFVAQASTQNNVSTILRHA
jgi:hypothetical protein